MGTPQTNASKTHSKTLAGIEYTHVNGMVFGADCHYHVTRHEIVAARFFHVDKSEYRDIQHVAITEEQWEPIERALSDIQHLYREVEPPSLFRRIVQKFSRPLPEPTDGPNETTFYLYWKDGDREIKKHYDPPHDRRFQTVLALLQETAYPTKKEIIYYPAPTIHGMYLHHGDPYGAKKDAFSFQMTPKDQGDTEEWCFFARYWDNGQLVNKTLTAPKDMWKKVYDELVVLNAEQWKTTSKLGQDDDYITFYYNDGKQIHCVGDNKAKDALRELFVQLLRESSAF